MVPSRRLTTRGVLAICASLALATAARGQAPPSNRTDSFHFGYYGGIREGETLQPGSGLDAITCYEMARNYGVDWLWLQGPRSSQEDGIREAILELKRQVRIIMRLVWWRHASYDDEYFPDGRAQPGEDGWEHQGPDWIHLADDPQALRTTLVIVENQIRDILEGCGDDALYAVSLAEEEPWSSMFSDPRRDASWVYDHREEASNKITFVTNEIYKHIKQKFPHVKVFTSFYAGVVLGQKEKILQDGVVMTKFPSVRPPIDKAVQEWLEHYPPGPDCYVLLRGDTPGRSQRSVRAAAKAHFDEIFQAFHDAGYRNIGWFGQNRKCVLHDHIAAVGENLSPGTWLNDDDNLAKTIIVEQEKRAGQDEIFAALAKRLPPAVVEQARRGRQMLDEATRQFDQGRNQEALASINRARGHYQAAIDHALTQAEQSRRQLELVPSLDEVIKDLQLDPGPQIEPAAIHVAESDYRLGTTFAYLPEFYQRSSLRLKNIGRKRQSVIAALKLRLTLPVDRSDLNPEQIETIKLQTLALIIALEGDDVQRVREAVRILKIAIRQATIVFQDDFDRSDSETLGAAWDAESQATSVAAPDNGWQRFGIRDQTATVTNDLGFVHPEVGRALVDLDRDGFDRDDNVDSSTGFRLTARIDCRDRGQETDTFAGLLFGFVDADNHWQLRTRNHGNLDDMVWMIHVIQVVDGVEKSHTQTPAPEPAENSWCQLSVEYDGTRLTASAGGPGPANPPIGPLTVPVADGGVGLFNRTVDGLWYWDDFVLEAPLSRE